MNSKDRNIHSLYQEMLIKGFVTASNAWIEKAIQQKHPQLPLSIANSKLLTYDKIDGKLLALINAN